MPASKNEAQRNDDAATMSRNPVPRPASLLLLAAAAFFPACSPVPTPAAPSVFVAPAQPASGEPAVEEAPRPAVGTCRIQGPHATLDVAVETGSEAFSVQVRGAPVTVVPGSGAVSAVAVEGALAFEGRSAHLTFFPSAPIAVADGIVQLGPMSILQDTSPRGPDLVARTVDIGGFTLGEVSVPCSGLSFVGSGDPTAEEGYHVGRYTRLRSLACTDPCQYYETAEGIDFHESPGSGVRVRLSGGTTFVARLERRGAWTRVATMDDVHMSAQLTGWVEHARLTELQGGIGFSGGWSRPQPLGGGIGTVGRGVRAGTFHGPVHADGGAPVFASPEGGAPWAYIRDGEAELDAIVEPGSNRAQVLRAPSFPSLGNAWIPVTRVHAIPARQRP